MVLSKNSLQIFMLLGDISASFTEGHFTAAEDFILRLLLGSASVIMSHSGLLKALDSPYWYLTDPEMNKISQIP
jgi:hypothetical protein